MPASKAPSVRGLLTAYFVVAWVAAGFLMVNVASRLRFEDAMIVLRYARNLVRGDGFVFNVGEKVLGVTTPLHTLLSTFYVAFGGESAATWQNVAGIVALVAEGALLVALLARWGRPWAALPAGLCVLGSFNLSWLYFGMETHLFAALALAVLLLASKKEPRRRSILRTPGRGTETALGLLLGLAFLLRYDAALLAALVGLERWLRQGRFPWRMTQVFFLVVLPWLVFAQLYFGSILPQPLRAKQGFAAPAQYFETLYGYYRQTFERLLLAYSPSTRAAIWGSFGLPAVLALGVFSSLRTNSRFWVFWLYPALHVGVYGALGSDPNFTWHHYLLNPFGFAAVALAIDEGVRWILRWTDRRSGSRRSFGGPNRRRRGASAVLFLACLPLMLHLSRRVTHEHRPDDLTRQLHLMGDWLKAEYPSHASVLQPAIGILGWRSDLRLIDHAGLVTPGLYFYNDQQCTPLDRVVTLYRPDLILQSPWSAYDAADLGYRPVHRFQDPFAYVVFERPGLGDSPTSEPPSPDAPEVPDDSEGSEGSPTPSS